MCACRILKRIFCKKLRKASVEIFPAPNGKKTKYIHFGSADLRIAEDESPVRSCVVN